MIYDYEDSSTLEIAYDSETQRLIVGDGIDIDETLVRRLKDMRLLFRDAQGYDDDTPLYYMYNGICRLEHKQLFVEQGIKYEYTLLLPAVINGECIKAHGHIHGISPITKTNHLEFYEVLGGEGYFELFKIVDNCCEVILIAVKKGDFVVIPPNYYHLSINTGNEPFNFGDLIVNDANSDYSLLKTYQGAPYYCLKDEKGSISFELNKAYKELTISFEMVNADTVPWDIPLMKAPLYAAFVANPRYFNRLK